MSRLISGLVVLLSAMLPPPVAAADWSDILAKARGQTVYFNAWGGGEQINAYIAWAAAELDSRYGVTLAHVKLADTADAVARVLAEKTAGRNEGGSVDLIWINGENFAAMKNAGLLFGPFAESLEIAQRLAASDRGNVVWQRDLSGSLMLLGDLAVAQGNLPEAQRLFAESLEIAQSLAVSDRGNAAWQRDLYVSYVKMAALLEKQGDQTAVEHWRRAHDIFAEKVQAGMHVSPEDRAVLDRLRRKRGP